MEVLIIILIILCFFCFFRIYRGPSMPDQMVAIDILGILGIGVCALMATYTKRDFLIDIALSWVFLSFVGTLALAKYLSGCDLDE